MTNKIVALKQKEIFAVAGGKRTIDTIAHYVDAATDCVEKPITYIIDQLDEPTWKYVIQPTIIIAGSLYSGIIAYTIARAAMKATKLKTH